MPYDPVLGVPPDQVAAYHTTQNVLVFDLDGGDPLGQLSIRDVDYRVDAISDCIDTYFQYNFIRGDGFGTGANSPYVNGLVIGKDPPPAPFVNTAALSIGGVVADRQLEVKFNWTVF